MSSSSSSSSAGHGLARPGLGLASSSSSSTSTIGIVVVERVVDLTELVVFDKRLFVEVLVGQLGWLFLLRLFFELFIVSPNHLVVISHLSVLRRRR